jgi:5-keto 4-deoxyuronate isomerase
VEQRLGDRRQELVNHSFNAIAAAWRCVIVIFMVARSISTAVKKQRKSREAVRRALERHKVYVVSRRFFDSGMSARVLIDGEYYDVNERELSRLEAGARPEKDLALEPVRDA